MLWYKKTTIQQREHDWADVFILTKEGSVYLSTCQRKPKASSQTRDILESSECLLSVVLGLPDILHCTLLRLYISSPILDTCRRSIVFPGTNYWSVVDSGIHKMKEKSIKRIVSLLTPKRQSLINCSSYIWSTMICFKGLIYFT